MSYLIFLLLVPIGLSLLTRIVSHQQSWAYFAQAEQVQDQSDWHPPVSIIVPVRGLDESASENFQTFCQQDYPAPYELIFALETDDDAALPAIQALIKQHPDKAIQVVFSDPLGSPGIGKIKNLIAGYEQSQHPVIVLVDSDVQLASDFLRRAVSSVESAEVGLSYAAPVCYGTQDWVAALHNIAVNASVLNYASTAYQQRTKGAVGSVMISRRDSLEKIGGLRPIAAQVVGIDVTLSQAIHAAGYKINLLSQPARIQHRHDTFKQFWWQMHRWLVTIRHYFPQLPILIIVLAIPLWWALLFLGISLFMQQYVTIGIGVVAFILLADAVSVAVINTKLVKDNDLWRYLWVAMLGELISLPIAIHSFFSDRVLWRGRWLSVKNAEAILDS